MCSALPQHSLALPFHFNPKNCFGSSHLGPSLCFHVVRAGCAREHSFKTQFKKSMLE